MSRSDDGEEDELDSEDEGEDGDEEWMSGASEMSSPTSTSLGVLRHPHHSGVAPEPLLLRTRKPSMDGTTGRMTSAACV
jgi:hypothetical protein